MASASFAWSRGQFDTQSSKNPAEVEAEQKMLEEAIKNARERERRTLLRAVLFHFPSNLLRLKELGVHGVITLIELGAHFFCLLVRYRILAPVSILLELS
ncbi:uncharacterized protein LOC130591628 isoform X2 [Beta vulgaris subsp. vulgaris]|uniref:uncharacterized protein LOC130591628 isoform X2 n=1 Tax=Beta vulgaris subsp. vulgaris TaxID=3555 RepID=UPI002548BD46|nr:uncharacterized protein LOC130591628 isoform X2 [Beta vulgaris subsp. vulgaris]XP_057251161.1 uncharacterized protein LOC130591628 isoform X2 [Beta vulgaris subsp. vulgaris]